MNRTFPLVAAALLATACYWPADRYCDGGTDVVFYWRFVDGQGHAAGDYSVQNTGCGIAGVDTIRISIDGSTTDHACVGPNGVPGIALTGFVYAGRYPYTVEAYRSGERVFATQGSVDVGSSCREERVLTDLAALSPQSFVVYYGYPGQVANACAFSGVAYRLLDQAGRIVSTTETAAGGQLPVTCDPASFGFSIPGLPLGTYHFQYVYGLDARGLGVFKACGVPVAHEGFPIDLVLGDYAPAGGAVGCP